MRCDLSDRQPPSTWRSSARRATRSATSFGNGSRLRSRLGRLRCLQPTWSCSVSLGTCSTCAARKIQTTFSSWTQRRGHGALRFLEDGADIGGEAGGKLRHTILADFNSDKFMSVVRVSALMCISYNISISVCGSFYAASAPMMNISAICSPKCGPRCWPSSTRRPRIRIWLSAEEAAAAAQRRLRGQSHRAVDAL